MPGARHADVEKPDHRVSLRSVLLVSGVTGWANIRKEKDDIRLAALYRVDGSDDYARRFLQRAWSAGQRRSDRKLHTRMECRRDAPGPPLEQLLGVAGRCQKRFERGRLKQFAEPLYGHREGIVGCVD